MNDKHSVSNVEKPAIEAGEVDAKENAETDAKEAFRVIVKSKIRAGRLPALIQGE